LPPSYRYAILRDQAYFIFNNAYHQPYYYQNQVVFVPVPVPQGAPSDASRVGEQRGDPKKSNKAKPQGQFKQGSGTPPKPATGDQDPPPDQS
jgi:hypothetical protein